MEPAVMKNHYKNKCRMLYTCDFCDQVVKGQEARNHWLYNCKRA